ALGAQGVAALFELTQLVDRRDVHLAEPLQALAQAVHPRPFLVGIALRRTGLERAELAAVFFAHRLGEMLAAQAHLGARHLGLVLRLAVLIERGLLRAPLLLDGMQLAAALRGGARRLGHLALQCRAALRLRGFAGVARGDVARQLLVLAPGAGLFPVDRR